MFEEHLIQNFILFFLFHLLKKNERNVNLLYMKTQTQENTATVLQKLQFFEY